MSSGRSDSIFAPSRIAGRATSAATPASGTNDGEADAGHREMELEQLAARVPRRVPLLADVRLTDGDAADGHHLTARAEPHHQDDHRDSDEARDGDDDHDDARVEAGTDPRRTGGARTGDRSSSQVVRDCCARLFPVSPLEPRVAELAAVAVLAGC